MGEFAGAGTFETTYLDDSLRISRGKQGFVDQLRVFIRSDKLGMEEALEEIVEKKASKQAVVDAQLDNDEEEEEETEIVAIDEEVEDTEKEDPPEPEMDKDEPEI